MHIVGAQARPSVGSLVAALPFKGQRDYLCHVAERLPYFTPRGSFSSSESYFNHVPGGAIVGSCAWPSLSSPGVREGNGERLGVPRAVQGQPCFPPSAKGGLFLSLPASAVPLVLEEGGPLVWRLCADVPAAADGACFLLRWAQEPLQSRR